ncbi:MAG: MlaD family protein [Candidatus Acidiferrales bacterium]|jgi:phospholipid/cholesterol/gamma-HCH transport system substrate-binding protein
MDSKREQTLVGLFVLIAVGLLIAAVFSISGILGNRGTEYRAYFKNAGGLGPGTQVRYAGGPPQGRVIKVTSDPQNPARMVIVFRVNPSVPVKSDSVAKIASLSALGDYFLEIEPGSAGAPAAAPGSTLKSLDFVALDQIESEIADLGPQATQLLQSLNARVNELQETIARVNDILNKENRGNLSASLAHINGLLAEDRPVIHSTLKHLDAVSAKAEPLLDDFKKTVAQANDAISHIDATLMENRPDLRESIKKLHEALISVAALADQLDHTLNANGEDIDEVLENVRLITENLKEFTDTIKERPSSLIRSSSPKEHRPGDGEKP